MNHLRNPSANSDLEDRLADFADRARAQQVTQAEAEADSELRSLQQTVIRLSTAFPHKWMDEAQVRRMQARIAPQVRQAWEESVPKWRSRQSRQRLVMAFAVGLAAIGVLVLSPLLAAGTSGGTATAITPTKAALAASAVAAVTLAILWFRSKH
jgi:hypothetical protein